MADDHMGSVRGDYKRNSGMAAGSAAGSGGMPLSVSPSIGRRDNH
jgi:hypothetical protein